MPDGGIENEELLLKAHAALLDPVPDDFLDPHLDGLPPPEPGEEVELLDFLVDFLLFQPLVQVDELDGLPVVIVTEALLADGIVLEVQLLVLRLYPLVIDDLQLVDVVLLQLGLLVPLHLAAGLQIQREVLGPAHQVQELVDVGSLLYHQFDVLLQ